MSRARGKTLEEIRTQLAAGQFVFSRHALSRVVERNISELEIKATSSNAVIIEEYPDDKYTPSCLLLGFTGQGRPLHIQLSSIASPQVRIITIYEPSLDQWEEYSKRR